MKKFKQIVCVTAALTLFCTFCTTGYAASRLYGNVNGDADITISDATLIQKHIARLDAIAEENAELADVNADGEIDVKDATCIQKYLASLDGGEKTGEAYYASQEDKLKEYKQEVLDLCNEQRTANGTEPLALDEELSYCADIRAAELAVSFSHTRPDGTMCNTVLEQNGVSYMYMGENIAAGHPTPYEVVNGNYGWMNSDGHRENILDKNFTKLGVGIYVKDGTYYWVQIFKG